jgi:hypothetical protein
MGKQHLPDGGCLQGQSASYPVGPLGCRSDESR